MRQVEDIYLNIEKYEKKKKFLDLCFNSNLQREISLDPSNALILIL